jgi:hypothetical protein
VDEDDSRCPLGECGSLLRRHVRVGKVRAGEGRRIGILNSDVENRIMKTFYLTNSFKYKYFVLGLLGYALIWGFFAYIAHGTCVSLIS